jgi:dihydrofolate reductase
MNTLTATPNLDASTASALPQLHVFLGISLDGCIAGEDGDLSWLSACAAESPRDTGYEELMASVDTLLLGRRTYEAVLGFEPWPFEGKRVRVLTHRPLPSRHGEQACSGPLDAVLAALAAEGARSVYLDGGEVVRQALRSDRVDRLTLSWIPVLLGRGTRLFADADLPRLHWQLLGSRAFASGMLQARYRRVPAPR